MTEFNNGKVTITSVHAKSLLVFLLYCNVFNKGVGVGFEKV